MTRRSRLNDKRSGTSVSDNSCVITLQWCAWYLTQCYRTVPISEFHAITVWLITLHASMNLWLLTTKAKVSKQASKQASKGLNLPLSTVHDIVHKCLCVREWQLLFVSSSSRQTVTKVRHILTRSAKNDVIIATTTCLSFESSHISHAASGKKSINTKGKYGALEECTANLTRTDIRTSAATGCGITVAALVWPVVHKSFRPHRKQVGSTNSRVVLCSMRILRNTLLCRMGRMQCC
jgi:hypothetical protein